MKIANINQALRALNKIEDKRDELRTEYDKQESKLKAAREEVERYLLEVMKEMGLQAFELPGQGVATIRTKRRFGVADWALFWDWIIEQKAPHFLQKRLLDTAMQKYLDDNGTLPPAVNTEARMTIVVTKRG